MIGDAFQNRRHLYNGNHETEIASGWLTEGNEVNAHSINLNFEPIHFVVTGEHVARSLAIALRQRFHSDMKRAFRLTAKQQYTVAQLREFSIQVSVWNHVHSQNIAGLFGLAFSLCQ
jgi:hypothetical protein